MPELPDIEAYLQALRPRILGHELVRTRRGGPFILRTVEPPIGSVDGRTVTGLRRIGKRIAIGVSGDLWLVLHLMIAGRLHWRVPDAKLAGRNALLALDFAHGSLVLTEAGSKRRASLHLVAGEAGLALHDRGGVEPLAVDLETFVSILRRENHTLKRALTDPRLFAGIGNAYSDEILHAAGLSPTALTAKVDNLEAERLFRATVATLSDWTEVLTREAEAAFRDRVPARDGRAWPLWPALPGMRHGGAADSLCGQRGQLLPALPDRRAGARRPEPVPAPGIRLATHDRGARGAV